MPVDPPHSGLRSLRLYVDGELARLRDQLGPLAERVTRLADTLEASTGAEAPAGAGAAPPAPAGGGPDEQAPAKAKGKARAKAPRTLPPVIHWPDLDPDTAARWWPRLEAWITDVFVARHPEAAAQALSECWREHPAAVDALTAGWLAWLAAYHPEAEPPLGAPLAWLADPVRGLPAMCAALVQVQKTCRGH